MRNRDHKVLVDLARTLGYLPEDVPGICYGVALTWLEACMLHEEEKHNLRIEKILKESTFLPGRINSIREAVKSGEEVTKDDIETLEVLSFYEKVTLNLMPNRYADFFNVQLSQGHHEQVMNFTSSDSMAALGGVKVINSQLGLYMTIKDVAAYLENIAKSIDQVGYEPDSQAIIGFVLSNKNHTIALNYNPVLRQWSLMDINQWPVRVFNESEYTQLAKRIIKGFGEGGYWTSFSTTVITKANDEKQDLLTEKLHVAMPQQITLPADSSEGDRIRWVYAASETGLVTLAVLNNRADIIEELAKEKVCLDVKTHKGYTPLHSAVWRGSVDCIETLLKHHASVAIENDEGYTPVHWAALKKSADCIEAFAKYGAPLDLAGSDGNTPAHVAAAWGRDKVVHFLAQCAPTLMSKQNRAGLTAVHLAALYNNVNIIGAIASIDASLLNIQSKSGLIPAHIAAQNGHLAFLKALSQHGVSLDQLGTGGVTLLFLAIQNGHANLVQYLFEECHVQKHPYTTSASLLTAFSNESNWDDEVRRKMDAFINLPHQEQENISVTPDQIAYITHRYEILKTLRPDQEQDFLNVLDKLNQKEKELQSRGHFNTAKAMKELHGKLTSALLSYYAGEPTEERYNEFHEMCSLAISTAKPQLARHRHLSGYLALGLFNTDSKNLAIEVEECINKMNLASFNSNLTINGTRNGQA